VEKKTLYLIIFAFAAIYIIWGSTYLFIKIGLTELPPFSLAGMRFTAAGIIIIFIHLLIGKKWNLTKNMIRNSVFAGFLFLTYGNGGVSWAMQYVDSSFAALIISAQPLILLILLWLLERKPILPKSWVGVALGFLGIYLLVTQNELVSTSSQWIGVAVIISCLFAWGYGSIFISKAELPPSYFLNSGIQMLSGGISMLIIGQIFGEDIPLLSSISPGVWSSLAFLIFFGSILAFTSFNFLLKHVSPEKVSTSTYVNPVIAMILGWLVLDELITFQSVAAAIILLMGVYFINFNKYRRIGIEETP